MDGPLPSSASYHISMSIAKRIPNKRDQKTVMDAFDVLCGMKSFEIFSSSLPPNLVNLEQTDVDRKTSHQGGLMEKTKRSV